jgi:mannose-6-phosphate isomerase-like protein (cupin superfamily)
VADGPFNLHSTFLRLRPDASVEPLPVDDTFWPRLMQGALGDFHREYLVTTATFEVDWPSWEKHPLGDEIVCLLSGEGTLVLEEAAGARQVELRRAGDYVLVPRDTWHTGRFTAPATLLFITAGEGTQTRPA